LPAVIISPNITAATRLSGVAVHPRRREEARAGLSVGFAGGGHAGAGGAGQGPGIFRHRAESGTSSPRAPRADVGGTGSDRLALSLALTIQRATDKTSRIRATPALDGHGNVSTRR
jgi:hypothetical protein